jgi:hypothetical protein
MGRPRRTERYSHHEGRADQVSDNPSEPFAPSLREAGTPIACITCPPHNVEMQVTSLHRAPVGIYVHLMCSNGHSQRFGIRSEEERVLIEMTPSPMSMPPQPGETVH